MSKVTFQDRLRFNAFCSHVTNPSRHVTSCTSHKVSEGASKDSKRIWESVNFAPRYHQVRLTSAKFDYFNQTSLHKRAESAKREVAKMAVLEKLMKERKNGRRSEEDKTGQREEFRTSFRQTLPRDLRENNGLVRSWRGFKTYPYRNPRPFDHRGLDPYILRTQLNTVKSPDPFRIRLKNRSLTGTFRESYADPTLSSGTRDIHFKFYTRKTPELRYDPKLLRKKGPYSPAFTAREAYLSRVYKNISTK